VALCAIPLLVFYAFLTGASASVVRACVMLSLLVAAPLFRRESDGVTSLTAALAGILLCNPFAAASISLQLSFAAMAGILFLTPRLFRLLTGGKNGRVRLYLISGFSATMGALVFTVPISAFYFGTLVLISPLSNLLCLWAASVVFIFGLLAVLLPPLGGILPLVPGFFAEYILVAADLLAEIPYHALSFCNPYLKFWLGFVYLLFGAAWLGKEKIGRKYATAAVGSLLTLIVTIHLGAARYDAPLSAVVLDVGQGQSVILASGGQYALVDCGSANSWYSPGEAAAHQLRTMGCQKLDYLILTHDDSDHVNGVPALLARMDAETILTSEGFTEETVYQLGTAQITVYPPLGEAGDNERGLSVLVTVGENDLLITGDMSAATERKLLESFDLPEIECLVAGHHGAKTSTSKNLLAALKPERVCISVGANSYGHPSTETLWRLKEQGCAVYRTDLQGDIHLFYH